MSAFVAFTSFLSGVVMGVGICAAILLHLVTSKSNNKSKANEKEIVLFQAPIEQQKQQKSEEIQHLQMIIDYLDDHNNPLKNIRGDLIRIQDKNKNIELPMDAKMKTIIEPSMVNGMEKDMLDKLSEIRDHGKQLKGVSNFLHEISKVFVGFSKELSKLSNTCKVHMNKTSSSSTNTKKEDLIINNWWQSLHLTFEHMSSGQEDLSSMISELANVTVNVQEELFLIEKRLLSESGRHFTNLRENISNFEAKLKEREKCREKLRSAKERVANPSSMSAIMSTSAAADYTKRKDRLKAVDAELKMQTKKLYDSQKEFFKLSPKIDNDVELANLKSVVETQSQLFKLTDNFERALDQNRNAAMRMKMQLINAATSLIQMLRDEDKIPYGKDKTYSSLITSSDGSSGGTIKIEDTIGFEASLQSILEGLLIQSQIKDLNYGNSSNNQTSSNGPILSSFTHSNSNNTNLIHPAGIKEEEKGILNMSQEYAACLAASNPSLLPELPPIFTKAIGVETCVWFNSFIGRVYRDAAFSKYFYNWFCAKLAVMLNKGSRPGFVEEFQVIGVEFGSLPPLLMNIQWSPLYRKRTKQQFDAPVAKPQETPVGDKEGVEEPTTRNRTDSVNTSFPLSATIDDNDFAGDVSHRDAILMRDRADSFTVDNIAEPAVAPILDGKEAQSKEQLNRSKKSTLSVNDNNINSSPIASATINNTHKKEDENSSNNNSNSNNNQNPTATPQPQPNESPAFDGNRFDEDTFDEFDFYAACTADMAFRSGIKFTISTKLWLNWPKERYASVPVVLNLHLAEMSGRIKFGVARGYSFLSFLHDPLTHITVRSEVGDQYKFKDVPQLSEFIVKKIKEIIHNRLVHPNFHKFRLIWPHNWWPEGVVDPAVLAAAKSNHNNNQQTETEKVSSDEKSAASTEPTIHANINITQDGTHIDITTPNTTETHNNDHVVQLETVKPTETMKTQNTHKITNNDNNNNNNITNIHEESKIKGTENSNKKLSVKGKFKKWIHSYSNSTNNDNQSQSKETIQQSLPNNSNNSKNNNIMNSTIRTPVSPHVTQNQKNDNNDQNNAKEDDDVPAFFSDIKWENILIRNQTRFLSSPIIPMNENLTSSGKILSRLSPDFLLNRRRVSKTYVNTLSWKMNAGGLHSLSLTDQEVVDLLANYSWPLLALPIARLYDRRPSSTIISSRSKRSISFTNDYISDEILPTSNPSVGRFRKRSNSIADFRSEYLSYLFPYLVLQKNDLKDRILTTIPIMNINQNKSNSSNDYDLSTGTMTSSQSRPGGGVSDNQLVQPKPHPRRKSSESSGIALPDNNNKKASAKHPSSSHPHSVTSNTTHSTSSWLARNLGDERLVVAKDKFSEFKKKFGLASEPNEKPDNHSSPISTSVSTFSERIGELFSVHEEEIVQTKPIKILKNMREDVSSTIAKTASPRRHSAPLSSGTSDSSNPTNNNNVNESHNNNNINNNTKVLTPPTDTSLLSSSNDPMKKAMISQNDSSSTTREKRMSAGQSGLTSIDVPRRRNSSGDSADSSEGGLGNVGAMKYVSSIFKGGNHNNSSNNNSVITNAGVESKANAMLSKAISTVRQHLDKDNNNNANNLTHYHYLSAAGSGSLSGSGSQVGNNNLKTSPRTSLNSSNGNGPLNPSNISNSNS
eukprot:gene10857-14574_t